MTDLEIFHNAPTDATPKELAAYLDQACGGDAILRDKVEALFAADQPTIDFLSESPAVNRPAQREASISTPTPDPADDHDPPSVKRTSKPDGAIMPYFGDYQLQGEVARGAMGVVYRAEQKSLKRIVAIKMIRSTLLASADDITRFRTEAEAAASLDHPNIVPIYEIGEHDGQHYFSMKLIEGGTLGDRRAELRRDPKAAAATLQTIAEALHSAHQRGILHRDIKPGNILLDQDGEPHITDFGLAKHLESNTSMTLSGQIMGTPHYMAPEQAEGAARDLTTAADIYALGAVFYEILTGQLPHKGESLMDTLRLVVEEAPAMPRSIDPRIDRDLETIAMKCLEKNPAQRYASAQAMATDLDRWQKGEPILARPVGTAERISKWMKRKPVHAAAAVLAVLLVLMLGIGGPIVALRQTQLREVADQEKSRADDAAALADERARQARTLLYAGEMHLAHGAEDQSGGASRIKTLLDHWRPQGDEPDLRGWEWYYMRSRLEQATLSLPHPVSAQAAIWSRDGEKIITGCDDGAIRIWDAATGRLLEKFIEEGQLRCLAVSPDGLELASLTDNGRMTIRILESGEIRLQLSATVAVAWNPQDSFIAYGVEKTKVVIADSKTGEIRDRLDVEAAIRDITWSHDGERLAIPTRRGTTIWDFADGATTFLARSTSTGPRYAIWDGQGNLFRGDGSFIRRYCPLEPQKNERFALTGSRESHRASLSKDGNSLAVATDDARIQILDSNSLERVESFSGHLRDITNLDWDPHGKRLLSSGYDAEVRVWTSGSPADPLESSVFAMIDWHPDSDVLAMSHHLFASIRDASDLGEIAGVKGTGIVYLRWSPDGARFAIGSATTLEIWDADAMNPLFSQTLPPEIHAINGIEWEPDGGRILVCHLGWRVGLYSTDNTVKLFDWEVFSISTGKTAVWHPQGKRFAMANGAKIEMRNADSGEIEQQWLTDHPVSAMDWHPSGELLATARDKDFLVEIWEIPSTKKLFEIQGVPLLLRDLAWSPDGELLALAGGDGVMRLWNRKQQQVVVSLEQEGQINDIDWDSDGLRIALAARGGTKIYDASRGYLAEGSPKAIPHLDREVRKNPDDPSPLNRRAELFEKLQRWQEAHDDWDALAQQHPDDPWYANRRLTASLELLEPSEAAAHLENLLAENPADPYPAYSLARLLFGKLNQPEWRVLEIETANSREGAVLLEQPDGSLLATGPNAENGELYEVGGRSPLPRIASIRFEPIPDERLPAGSSGRSPFGYFTLSGFSAEHATADGATPLVFADGWADYNTLRAERLTRILDDNPKGHINTTTRSATFDLAAPITIDSASGDRLKISLPTGGAKYENLGRFRLSVTDRPHAARIAELQHRLNAELPADDGWELLGIARSLQDQPQAAAQAFTQALALAPTDAERQRIQETINRDPRVAAILQKAGSTPE